MRALILLLSCIIGPGLMFASPLVGYAIGDQVTADGVNAVIGLIVGLAIGLAGYCILWYGLHQFKEM